MIKIGIVCLIPNNQIVKYCSDNKFIQKVKTTYENFILTNNFNVQTITLVGNGHPWINHLPVELYLTNKETNAEPSNNYHGIELYMCTGINIKSKIFMNTHEGRKLNTYHEQCKIDTELDSLEQLTYIVKEKLPNKKIQIKRGFKQANTLMVRNCTHVLVFGIEAKPDSEFWDKILCDKQYFCLVD
jgi:hypothetical protein